MAKTARGNLFVQSIKTIAVLVVISLVCGILLAISNYLFFVSDEEKFASSVQSVYEGFQKQEELEVEQFDCELGKINKVVKSTDGGYVLESVGNGGFKEGTVTLYVGVNAKGQITGWAIKENVNQSFISKISKTHQESWYIPSNDNVTKDISTDYNMDYSKVAGATYTSTAINNAINTVARYAREFLFTQGGAN